MNKNVNIIIQKSFVEHLLPWNRLEQNASVLQKIHSLRIIDREGLIFYWITDESKPRGSKLKVAGTKFGIPHRFIYRSRENCSFLQSTGHRILATIKYWKFFYSYFYGSLNWFNRALSNQFILLTLRLHYLDLNCWWTRPSSNYRDAGCMIDYP